MKKTLLIICSLFFVSTLILGTAFGATEAPQPQPGASLASLQLYDLQGHQFTMSEVKTGRVVVIFWAFWCDTWKKALPSIQELTAEQQDLDCTVLTVSVDGRYTEEIRPLVNAGKIPFPVLLDDGSWTKQLGLRRVPTVVVLDQQRKVVWLREAYPGNAKLKDAIRAMK